ncbi:T. brucei spp.-specific protein [Trypanosoma brucei gambiense DAL972]|uniref:T. brucei spp.-specific protein n=1 Tax=Trypanosoma brucei gambiense (strain MHOM/CI/86/DAL972) TaxID=679716 RepID=D0AAA5_TRYB9|nr:T. brucei spp.-specific protein [Trypanosoma brucei gambiense DAL972]CBH18606.1 T. brucei spp.-specific protein [Trypanosoma brucei gambiense DAL972]|eukprot:XP_011780870.1 T. brucei spp.-specific protein [Trypanosoma brucei gambiense DAL972]
MTFSSVQSSVHLYSNVVELAIRYTDLCAFCGRKEHEGENGSTKGDRAETSGSWHFHLARSKEPIAVSCLHAIMQRTNILGGRVNLSFTFERVPPFGGHKSRAVIQLASFHYSKNMRLCLNVAYLPQEEVRLKTVRAHVYSDCNVLEVACWRVFVFLGRSTTFY